MSQTTKQINKQSPCVTEEMVVEHVPGPVEQTLIEAKHKLEDPQNWGAIQFVRSGPHGEKYCALGAVGWRSGPRGGCVHTEIESTCHEMLHRTRATVEPYYDIGVGCLNDRLHEGGRHDLLMKWFDDAIALARKGGL